MSQVAESAARLSACQSYYGFPIVATVTLADDVLMTRTSTYTDVVIVVSTSTAYSTADETSTVYETVHSTETEYTTTITNTVSTTVTASPAVVTLKKKLRRRGRCKPTTTTSTTTTTAAPVPDDVEINPVPSNCENFSEWASACSCLDLGTVTESGGVPATSVIDETVTVTAPSTTETVVTVGVTTVVVKPATTTLVSTLSTQTIAITTVASTINPAPPVPTSFRIMMETSGSPAKYLMLSNSVGPRYLTTSSTGTQFYMAPDGDTLAMDSDHAISMYTSQATTYGVVWFTSSASATYFKDTCRMDPDTLIISCSGPGQSGVTLSRFRLCSGIVVLTTESTNLSCEGPYQMKAVPI